MNLFYPQPPKRLHVELGIVRWVVLGLVVVVVLPLSKPSTVKKIQFIYLRSTLYWLCTLLSHRLHCSAY